MIKTCYMCDAPATGREHVPPRGLFPESKDLPGTNYRENLITVPSCDEHNSAKSKDDEYLMKILPVYFRNNPVARKHIDTKVLRALERKPKIATDLVKDGGVLDDGRAFMCFDSERIFNVYEHITKGLYYHEFKKKWLLPVQFVSSVFLPNNENLHAFYEESQKFEKHTDLLLEHEGILFHGDNPDIFEYRLIETMDNGLVIQLQFYGGVRVSGISRMTGGSNEKN